ncbi:alpha/beta hydrolase [Vibrio lentus]|uniref:Alpha/beta hydrolase n=1 Tax=Vibrio lentus TaxID=136468 RepID=A0AB36XIB9_9VIBR|nr:alpha/beta hydrolase [Vibrio lentus]MCC4835837.1 alpha/beta hydrolase [Vibrio lentus]PMI10901.1 alpha/beta hydrolase [Vibrio lentus]PMK35182.1 alpha/beta hydrolase [Vibrio lentus]PMK43304.1 alpha/beta hydrolase [Vibrio lentus]PML32210.1 alpha/beta hydrolase [Vibrio lentus]
MKEFKVKGSNAILRYYDLPGSEVPIIFIHGIGCASSFDYPAVASSDWLLPHRRILVDLLGSGFSDKPEDFDYSIGSHAAYLEAFIQSLGLDKFVIYGHSMGGAVSVVLAEKVQPQLQALVLSEANLDSGGGFFSKKIASYTELEYANHGHAQIVQHSIDNQNTQWAASLAVNLAIGTHRQAVSLIEGQRPGWRDRLYSLNVNRTYLFGSESLPDSDTEELSNHGIAISLVSDAGHSMAWENADGLAEAIKRAIPIT